MEPYKEMYYKLFNAMADAIHQILRMETADAVETMLVAQQLTEEMYMAAGD